MLVIIVSLGFGIVKPRLGPGYWDKYHKVVDCLTEWRDLWVDEAFWHLLFSVILCVIMILWRPSQNNQRYAFTPLLDREEDYSSDEDVLYNDAWDGMKMRGSKPHRPATPKGADPEEDPLKWVEENIPDIEGALPVIDSEEEIETTKIEISKLQKSEQRGDILRENIHTSEVRFYCL